MLAGPGCGSGSGESTSTPEPAEALASGSGEADRELAEALGLEGENPEGPGCGVGIASSDDTAQAAYGLADLDSGRPIGSETVFDLASNSKQFTGAAVVLLASDGELGLDDPVAGYVEPMGEYPHEVTIGHLLHHTSGIPEYFDLFEDRQDETVTQEEAVEAIAGLDPDFAPGEEFAYTNSNYVLLAEVIEEASGQDYADTLSDLVFEPAGMADTFVHDYSSSEEAMATSYDTGGDALSSTWSQQGDGAIHSTVTDMLRWGRHLVDDQDLVALISQGAVPSGEGESYGAGLVVTERGDGTLTLAHEGSWLGFETFFEVVPEHELVAVVLCNQEDSGGDGLLVAAMELTARL